MDGMEAFTGYWKRPDADAKSIRDGWYFTGDLGYFDKDGELFVAGRVDDMVISGVKTFIPKKWRIFCQSRLKLSRWQSSECPTSAWGPL